LNKNKEPAQKVIILLEIHDKYLCRRKSWVVNNFGYGETGKTYVGVKKENRDASELLRC